MQKHVEHRLRHCVVWAESSNQSRLTSRVGFGKSRPTDKQVIAGSNTAVSGKAFAFCLGTHEQFDLFLRGKFTSVSAVVVKRGSLCVDEEISRPSPFSNPCPRFRKAPLFVPCLSHLKGTSKGQAWCGAGPSLPSQNC